MFAQHMVKEYLQTKVLNYISSSGHASRLVFFGGTSLRFCHGLDRFSEDLDFDYFGENREDLRDIFEGISRDIRKQGMPCETEHSLAGGDNYCKLVFPGISQVYQLGYPRKKIWIKIDIQHNRTNYNKEMHYVNRFGFFFPVHLPEKNILLSMKAVALTLRTKARDMYDFSFLSTNASLEMPYIIHELKLRGVMIDSPGQLKALIMQKEAETDIREKVHEISLFLMDKGNALRVAHFFPWLRSMDFEKI